MDLELSYEERERCFECPWQFFNYPGIYVVKQFNKLCGRGVYRVRGIC